MVVSQLEIGSGERNRSYTDMLRGKKHMPKAPSGHMRPADVAANAVRVMQIATDEIDESRPVYEGKDAAAVDLGRRGGEARAKLLTPAKRREIAQKAAQKRWR